MKILSSILFIVFALAFNVEKDETLARAEKISGVPVFVYAKPTAGFEILGKAVSTKKILMIAANETATVREKATGLVNEALKRKEEGKNPDFDAIIIDPERDKMQIIKFKEKPSVEARVERFDDVPFFFFSKPLNDYQTIDTLQADMSLYAKRGMLSDKIQSIMNRLLKKKKKGETKDFDAVIISPDDLSLTLIKFKQ